MYFFYNPTTRKIISATNMGLTGEELETLRPPGAEVIEKDHNTLPNWQGNLEDYYVSDEGEIVLANTYSDFASAISVKADEYYTWEVVDVNTQIFDVARGAVHSPSVGDLIFFNANDPGRYRFEISSKTYKTATLILEVIL